MSDYNSPTWEAPYSDDVPSEPETHSDPSWRIDLTTLPQPPRLFQSFPRGSTWPLIPHTLHRHYLAVRYGLVYQTHLAGRPLTGEEAHTLAHIQARAFATSSYAYPLAVGWAAYRWNRTRSTLRCSPFYDLVPPTPDRPRQVLPYWDASTCSLRIFSEIKPLNFLPVAHRLRALHLIRGYCYYTFSYLFVHPLIYATTYLRPFWQRSYDPRLQAWNEDVSRKYHDDLEASMRAWMTRPPGVHAVEREGKRPERARKGVGEENNREQDEWQDDRDGKSW